MTERFVNQKDLEGKAQAIIGQLQEVAANHERKYPSDIQAVLVFSGPGTYYEQLKPGEPEWMKLMNRDRVRAGTAVVREVTASRKADDLGLPRGEIHGSKMIYDDVLTYGPYLVYNGVPIKDPRLEHENKTVREAFHSRFSKLPEQKILVIDELRDVDGTLRPLRHTGDQINSLFQQLQDVNSPIYGVRNLALVSHLAHFIRIPFYLKKYEDEFVANGGYRLNYFVYPLIGRPGVYEKDIEWEMPRLLEYAAKGDLATEPVKLNR